MKFSFWSIFLTILAASCARSGDQNADAVRKAITTKKTMETTAAPNKTDTATVAAGCFWCVEAVFQDIEGVISVKSGYIGGTVPNPTYKEVCGGGTGHAEALRIVYDPSKVSYTELLEIFFTAHDPTTLNRQGADVGTQYRSAIFYHNEEQHTLAEKVKQELNNSGAFDNPVVTQITAATEFYAAEDYHQSYFNENGEQPYCKFVIRPKVDKVHKIFKDKLKQGVH